MTKQHKIPKSTLLWFENRYFEMEKEGNWKGIFGEKSVDEIMKSVINSKVSPHIPQNHPLYKYVEKGK
jgi:hypothetical protein